MNTFRDDWAIEDIPPESDSGGNGQGRTPRARCHVQLPGANRLLSEFATDLAEILAPTNIFQRSGLTFTVNPKEDGLLLVTKQMLRTWVEQYCCCYKVQQDESGQMVKFLLTMIEKDADGVLAAVQFVGRLKEVERFNLVRMPVMRPDGSVELLPTGYDPQAKTYTSAIRNPPITRLPLVDAKRVIDNLFGEFPFADDGRSKAVAVAAMLTVYALNLLPPKSLRPCFVFLANAEGAGKTLLVKICTVPILGYTPTGCKPKDEDEMKKLLLSIVMEAKAVLFFDNLKSHIDSASLEAFLTTQDYSGRMLGVNRTFTGPNNVTTFITGNACTLSSDMRRRCLVGELFMQEEKAEDREFGQELEVPLLLAKRWEILNALWTFVSEWVQRGKPPPSRSHSAFPAWAQIIGGIVECVGYRCPLETPSITVDTNAEDMRTLVTKIANSNRTQELDFKRVVAIAQENGLFEWLLPDDDDLNPKTRSKFASILKSYHRRLVGGYRFTVLGEGRNRRFQVEQITPV
jgi:hypothetical protein